MFHNPFCAMKHPTSNSSLNPLHSLLATLLFSPSTSRPFAFLSGLPSFFKLEDSFQQVSVLFGVFAFWPATVDQLHHTKASQFGCTLRTMPCPLKCALPHIFSLWLESFSYNLGPPNLLDIFTLSLLLPHLMLRYVFAAVCRPLRAMLLSFHFFCPQESTFLSALVCRSSQSCHSSTKQ